MTDELIPLLRTRAASARSAVDGVLDLLIDLSPAAPSAADEERFREDAFQLARALGESAALLEATAGLLECLPPELRRAC